MRRCVLVVEADEQLRCLLVDLLRERGCDVRQAASAAAAVRVALAKPPPHVALLDMEMRDANEVLATFASLGVPVIVMSTWRGMPLPHGATERLDKPFDLHDLFALVERHCGPS